MKKRPEAPDMKSELIWKKYEGDPRIVPLNKLMIVENPVSKGKVETLREFGSIIGIQYDMYHGCYFALYPDSPLGKVKMS